MIGAARNLFTRQCTGRRGSIYVIRLEQSRIASISARGGPQRGGTLSSAIRSFSAVPPQQTNDDDSSFQSTKEAELSFNDPSFDETLNKLFESQANATTTTTTTEAANALGAIAGEPFNPSWYSVSDQAINAIQLFQETTGLGLGYSVIGVTFAIRILLFPVFVDTQRNSSRMAHMQPEMQLLKARIDALGSNIDQETQVRYGLQMRALFRKYECNPFRSLLLPILQLPIFMGMFFGLREMPKYFPEEMAKGGMLWFPDLSVADPYYLLPLGSAITFLVTIELGKEQMIASSPQQGQMMVNIFRVLGVTMFPAVCSFSAGLNCYWMVNNTMTLIQSLLFKNPSIRAMLGIWDPPKPVPGMPQPKGIMESIEEMTRSKPPSEADKIKAHNETIEQRKRASSLGASRSATRTRRGATKRRQQ